MTSSAPIKLQKHWLKNWWNCSIEQLHMDHNQVSGEGKITPSLGTGKSLRVREADAKIWRNLIEKASQTASWGFSLGCVRAAVVSSYTHVAFFLFVCWSTANSSSAIFFTLLQKCFFLYLRQGVRAQVGGGAEGEGEATSPLDKEYHVGFNLMTLGSWPEQRQTLNKLSQPGALVLCFFNVIKNVNFSWGIM